MASAGKGVTVTPVSREVNSDGTSQLKPGISRQHFIVISGIFADSPARWKLWYAVASALAYRACSFCRLCGTLVNKVVRFLGWAAPATVTEGPPEEIGKTYSMADAAGRHFTHDEMMTESCTAGKTRHHGSDLHASSRQYRVHQRCLYTAKPRA